MLSEIIKSVENDYQAWWDHKNKNALLYITYPNEKYNPERLKQLQKPWMQPGTGRIWALAQGLERAVKTEDLRYVSEALDLVEAEFEMMGFAGSGFPSYFVNIGAGCVAAFLTGYSNFYNDTVWFELEKPLGWEEIDTLLDSPLSRYYEITEQAVKMAAERLTGKVILSQLDLGGIMDILASLRRTDNLLFDVIDSPDEVKKAAGKILNRWKTFNDRILAILKPANQNYYTSWMTILSKDPYYPSQCDFCAMLSPGMFDEFVLPNLTKEMSVFRKGLYHLDGPGEVPHLDSLCKIPNLHAVQWVPTQLLNIGQEEHYPLYARLIEKGKKVVLLGSHVEPEVLKKFFSKLPKEEFFLNLPAKDRDEAERLADLA